MTRITRRTFLEHSLAGGAAVGATSLTAGLAWGGARRFPGEPIRIGVIGVRGRGRAHIGAFKGSPDAEVVAICDPDEGVIGPAMKAVPDAKFYRDMREMLDDPSIDAVSIATPNHWHSLASIWALQAGKHVYVEKPLSHNVFEGRQVVNAVRKYGKILQHGTQSRSSQATRDAIAWMRGGGLGEVRLAHALCYKRRQSIGKVDGPQDPPATLDYELWTGPAKMEPLMRKSLHYDWHWVYNTGSGDIGNQGVHQMDIARWGMGLDTLPTQVTSCGGRLGYDDDGNTANSQVALYDYGEKKIIFEVRGLETPANRGAHVGVIFHCEDGYLVSASYNKLQAFDNDGQVVKEFNGAGNHFQNWLDAIKADDAGVLTTTPEMAHLSAALCNLGNIAYRLGEAQRLDSTDIPFGYQKQANEVFGKMREHLIANGIDPKKTDYQVGPELAFDPEKERFTGEGAARANRLLTRPAREPFVVPEKV
jgi:predicted dehydrogenase